jgi:hypothetical protein
MDDTWVDRSQRRSRAELHDLLVDAGRDILLEEGLGTGAEHLTFKRVFERLEAESGVRVTNASVIGRIWASQEEFQLDVLCAIADDDIGIGLDDTVRAILPVLEHLDRSTLEGRSAGVRELCRIGGAANLDSLVGSRMWRTWVGVWALVMTGLSTPDHRSIETSLRLGYEHVTLDYEELYGGLVSHLGLTLRPPLTMRQFVVAAAAMGEGCALRDSVDTDSFRRIIRPTGPGGGDQEWTLFGIGLEALAEEFFFIDPAWNAS